jgi:type III secretion protein L
MKFFSLLYEKEIHPSKEQKIIPAEEFSHLVTAQEILEKVKEEAQRYREENERMCAELQEKAKNEGFQEGLNSFNEHLVRFEQELKKIRHEAHRLILPLALKAAKKIVARQLELHPETIVDIVLQALAPVIQNHKIKIYVNKADRDILEANKSKIKAVLEQLESLIIQERPDVSLGGCIIETETGIINAGIENQWLALERAFDKYMKHS